MTDQSNVFNNEQAPVAPVAPAAQEQQAPLAQQPQSTDAYADQLKAILAEDGRQKYGSVEKALEALAHSQTLIPTLQSKSTEQEQELNKLRAELAKASGVQEALDKFTQHQQDDNGGNPSNGQFGEEEVNRLLDEALNKRTQRDTVASNTKRVNDTLVSTFGEQAMTVVQAKAKELNMTPVALGQLAEQNPDLVLALFGGKTPSPSTTTTTHSLGFTPPTDQPLGRPEKSLLSGAKTADQMDYMRKVRAEVYAKFGITQ